MESDPWSSSTVLFVKAEASLVDTVGGLLHTLVGDASKSPPSRHQHPSSPPSPCLNSPSSVRPY